MSHQPPVPIRSAEHACVDEDSFSDEVAVPPGFRYTGEGWWSGNHTWECVRCGRIIGL